MKERPLKPRVLLRTMEGPTSIINRSARAMVMAPPRRLQQILTHSTMKKGGYVGCNGATTS